MFTKLIVRIFPFRSIESTRRRVHAKHMMNAEQKLSSTKQDEIDRIESIISVLRKIMFKIDLIIRPNC